MSKKPAQSCSFCSIKAEFTVGLKYSGTGLYYSQFEETLWIPLCQDHYFASRRGYTLQYPTEFIIEVPKQVEDE